MKIDSIHMRSLIALAVVTLCVAGCGKDGGVAVDSKPSDATSTPATNSGQGQSASVDAQSANGEATVPATPLEPTPNSPPPSQDAAAVLTIGSKAPSLDIEHWVSNGNGRFSSVTDFTPGNVYVVEFWATWCGPCISSMPHLAETQEAFAEKGVQLISISDEDLPTVEEFLKRPFEGSEGGPATFGELTSVYSLTTDPDRSNHTNFMQAAGQNGIPTAFIVGRTGLIEWIGHPMTMDEPLAKVVGDEWDRELFAKEFEASQKIELMQRDIMMLAQRGDIDGAMEMINKVRAETQDPQLLMQLANMSAQLKVMPVSQLLQQGDTDGAIAKLDELIASATDVEQERLQMMRLSLLLRFAPEKAAAALTDLASREVLNEMQANQISWQIFQQSEEDPDLSPALIDAAVELMRKSTSTTTDGSIWDTFARLLHRQGKLDEALEAQTKAAENPGPSADAINEFLEQLKAEKAGLAAPAAAEADAE
jgi:thiol-disulfide isomerase/thioredoxin